MAHGYRTLQHWDQWLVQNFFGPVVLEAEQQSLTQLLAKHFGKHALLIGTPNQHALLTSTMIPFRTLFSPIAHAGIEYATAESDLNELPVLTGSADLVMLPHTLEFVDNPRQLLNEACRIVKPEGLIVITGFNPYSAWGLNKVLSRHKKSVPWAANFIHSRSMRNWLTLADFEIETYESVLFRPPIGRANFFNKLEFLEKMGKTLFPALGGIYLLVARAKVIPLTPIKMKWKQRFGDIRISTTIPGHMVRSSGTK